LIVPVGSFRGSRRIAGFPVKTGDCPIVERLSQWMGRARRLTWCLHR
jgi:hypothetical protein